MILQLLAPFLFFTLIAGHLYLSLCLGFQGHVVQPILTPNGTVLPAILVAPLQNALCPLESVTLFHHYITCDGQCPGQRTLSGCLENVYCIKGIQLRALLRKLCEEPGCHRLNASVPPHSCVGVLT